MALQLFDRVQVTATANTTVSFTLGSAIAGYQSFSVMTNGNTTYYGSSDGTNWEVGIGTYSSTGPTLTRTTILSSSNAGAAVTFTGTPTVWIDYPSSQSVYLNNNVVSVPTYVATQTVSGSSSTGAYSYGTLNGSDTGVMASFQTSIAGYSYVAIQNTSSNSAATTDIALFNDTASLGKYIDMGINSTTYTGTGSFSLANASYIYSYGGDLSVGTYTANAIHFIINNGATDAMTIQTSGGVSVGTATDPGATNLQVAGAIVSTRVNPRALASTANSATPTLNTDNYDIMVITGQSVAITSFTTNLTGTPVNGQKLWISITGTTAIAITWGASFEASTVPLPTTTVTTARLDVGFVWNVATSKWRCVATA